jgi:hypothetical protein
MKSQITAEDFCGASWAEGGHHAPHVDLDGRSYRDPRQALNMLWIAEKPA